MLNLSFNVHAYLRLITILFCIMKFGLPHLSFEGSNSPCHQLGFPLMCAYLGIRSNLAWDTKGAQEAKVVEFQTLNFTNLQAAGVGRLYFRIRSSAK